ncbi:hypothetical protein J437_LFUL015732 [Ladona fulva]|uniref:Uncharacterized protein n=1 Tax=Ladona fulva TaxID=123851 RepID=A0A8K0KI49_LADFU|nr:hypothetical protein J437_LFUL015732 [Ladona fulva]
MQTLYDVTVGRIRSVGGTGAVRDDAEMFGAVVCEGAVATEGAVGSVEVGFELLVVGANVEAAAVVVVAADEGAESVEAEDFADYTFEAFALAVSAASVAEAEVAELVGGVETLNFEAEALLRESGVSFVPDLQRRMKTHTTQRSRSGQPVQRKIFSTQNFCLSNIPPTLNTDNYLARSSVTMMFVIYLKVLLFGCMEEKNEKIYYITHRTWDPSSNFPTLLLANRSPTPSMQTCSKPPSPVFMSCTGNSPPSSTPAAKAPLPLDAALSIASFMHVCVNEELITDFKNSPSSLCWLYKVHWDIKQLKTHIPLLDLTVGHSAAKGLLSCPVSLKSRVHDDASMYQLSKRINNYRMSMASPPPPYEKWLLHGMIGNITHERANGLTFRKRAKRLNLLSNPEGPRHGGGG